MPTHRCCGICTIHNRAFQCNRPGTYTHAGKHYCNYHRPDALKPPKTKPPPPSNYIHDAILRKKAQEAATLQRREDSYWALIDTTDPIRWVEEAKRLLREANLLSHLSHLMEPPHASPPHPGHRADDPAPGPPPPPLQS